MHSQDSSREVEGGMGPGWKSTPDVCENGPVAFPIDPFNTLIKLQGFLVWDHPFIPGVNSPHIS